MVALSASWFTPQSARSQSATETTLGDIETTNIFPSRIKSDGWSQETNALTQDLSNESLYQDFTTSNSAYLGSPTVESAPAPIDTVAPTDTVETPTSESEVPAQESEIETEVPVESEQPVSFLNRLDYLSRLPRAKVYPLAQLSVTSSPEVIIEDTTNSDDMSESIDIALNENDETVVEGTYRDIVLDGFDTPSLDAGHFIDGMQLRVSLAARSEVGEDEQSPYVEILLGDASSTQSVGVILLDGEVSNAINGGYYLFALPSFIPVEKLNETTVTLRYFGEESQLEALYLDAAWLEMTTKEISKEELLERGTAENLVHLEAPDLSVLVSDQLNFARTEKPIFNLRYEPQQNFILRGFYKLFGKSSLEVKEVYLVHETVGEIKVNPIITVTGDGLITLEVPEEDLEQMVPGVYSVNLIINENGTEFTDTFDFQWGILGLNPYKSEYQIGETVKVAIGALSQNGNTICDARLDLYITDPAGLVSKTPVTSTGECNGNNVIDVPDYTAEFVASAAGEYQFYLERLSEDGSLLAFTTDTVQVVDEQLYSIERNGPTRIYPVAPYEMSLTVKAKNGFTGVVRETVPASFVVGTTTAEITDNGEWKTLTWNVSLGADESTTVSYGFDAPDISPYLYMVGSAELERVTNTPIEVSLQTASGTESVIENASSTTAENAEESTQAQADIVFREHRQWQIASDATGSMILMWDGPVVPTGWTCISCTGGDVFYQRFIVGSSTVGVTGGAATHTHTYTSATMANNATAGVSATGGGGADAAQRVHTHTITPAIAAASNLPSYRNLVIIQHNSAGEPTSIPAGAIAVFDATVPAGWTQYAAQNGFYVRGESIANVGVTGGANTHTHGITGTSGGPNSTTNAPGTSGVSVATQAHTHTINTTTASQSNEPPYIETILGKLNSTTTMPDNAITMWSDDVPSGWTHVSTSSAALENRFFKPSAAYGTTGGATNHTPADVTGIVTSAPSATVNRSTNAANADASGSHTHTVNVTGFSNATHLPPYRSVIFGKRAGGMPPNAPTVHTLFDDEKTGTSTPAFEFTANDPYGVDTLVYQFQWDDDSNLDDTPLGNRTSDVETGCSPNCFSNTVTGGDTNPFNENERIRFTIQSPLTNGETYFFRVRAKKTIGGTWGTWSEVRAFTYVNDTDPSQWMQTVDDQFTKGTLFDTEVFGSDSVRILQNTPDEALVMYGEGVVTTPRFRLWNGTAWSAEQDALDVGGVVQWIRIRAGTTRDEYVAGTHDANNDVNVQVYDANSDTWGDLLEVTATANDTTRRAFDVAYETSSGDALVVYCSGTDAAYRVWNGTSWSGATTITTASPSNCNYIALASDPTSDEIVLVTRDTGVNATDYEALVWNGSSWGNSVTLGTMTDLNNEGIAVSYEESGGQAVVTTSNGGNNSFLWTAWNGTEWSTPVAQGLGNDYQWGTLKSDVGTDNMALCYIDTDNDIGLVRWNGESWLTNQEIETFGNADTGRAISCEFEVTSGRDGNIMIPYSDNTAARYQFWNGTAFSAEASISTIQDSWEVGTARTGDGKILAYFHDDVNTQYDFSYWNGTAWSSIQTLETSPSVTATPFRQPVNMAAQIYIPSQGTITSDPVSFTSVPNRSTWGEAIWQTTEPNGTDVKLQVLYATTSACNVLIPDGALPGNSTGFDATQAPLNLSTLSTSTYANLCLRATLTSSNQSTPTLDDWTISWERQPFLVQTNFRWYANRNSENPNDAWPSGVIDLLQNDEITQDYSPGSGDVLRLRIAVRSDNAPLLAASKTFKLQYAEESGLCASSTAWFDVGSIGSSTALWRGYNNLLAFDGSTLSTLLLGSDVGGTYEEENNSNVNPNTVAVGNEAEWDWVLEHNGAVDGVQYCFRMVASNGEVLSDYDNYPSLLTNTAPTAPILEKRFDNERVASTSPWFEFVAEDLENDDVSYQIQIDDTYNFSSTVIDRNSTTNFSEFENIVTPADKDAFTVGQTIRFKPTTTLTNNTTYYWRVRAKDGAGSNTWGDWSTVYSFNVNTGTTVTTWFQTEQEQFDTDELSDTETTGSDDVILSTGFTVGTTTSSAIDFDDKTTGNAWGSLSWNHNVTTGSIRYRIEYLNNGVWELVPNAFLPGNSAGFTSSPVSLLGLDPQVHNEIRVRANLTDSGGSPRLLDWTVQWGYAVEQPTLVDLFDNEKVGTTTPTFRFDTTDPENNDLQYEISWSTDNTFAGASTSKLSGTDAGFADETNSGDTSPFASGDDIQFKIQPANALTNNTTYWWRVRARDPFGGNVWSVWSEARSFTVDTTIGVSTWHQTTDEQFETDTLTNLESTGSDGVEIASIIREAFMAYAEGTIQTPRYRLWNGTTWGAEQSALSVGSSIRFVETATSDVRDEYMIVTQEATGRVRAQVYDGASATVGDLHTVVAAVPRLLYRGFDVAYESNSGDVIVVACSGTEAVYSVWNGSSWSGPTALTLGVAGNCNWIQMASDPTSDEIILVARDTIAGITDYEAQVWNGSAWGNATTFGVATEANNEGIAIEYEESGDRAVVVLPNTTNASFLWNSWNGTAWSGSAAIAIQDDFENGRLVRDMGTDNMVLCETDNDSQIGYIRWNGTTNAWLTPYTQVDATGNGKSARPFGCQYETTAGRDGYIMMPYSDTVAARYRVFDGSTFPAEASISTIQDVAEIRTTRTGDGKILGLFYDDINTQYDFSYWNGTTWSTIETLEGTAITTNTPPSIPFDIVARQYPTFTEGTIVSTPIDFDDGSGLKWSSVTFNDTTPGSSDITYQIEYYDGDSWELIPNGALAGNSTGFTTSPIDISQISRITYNQIRLKASLACVAGNCPTLNDWTVTWSEGINVRGTTKQYNQTSSTTAGTVAVAVNGTLQTGKTGTISNGSWSIANVTAFEGDIVTVFVSGAADSAEAVAVTRYDGDGDISGMTMFERHLVLGSNDATSTPMTNANIGLYDFTNTEDIFFNGNGTTLSMCATTGCADTKLYVKNNVRYSPGGRLVTHDFVNYGYFTAGSFTHEINGSWDNNATSTMTGSTVVFAATSTTETIDSTGALVAAFNNVTFGTTTGNASWTLGSTLDVDGSLTVSRGTLARANTPITIGASLFNEANGVWTGRGTTTFDGSTAGTWRDQNSSLQNVGKVVVDGTSKAVTLASNVAAESILIGANDTLDVSTSNYDISVYGNWRNDNNFVARQGEVFFAATSTGKTITTTGDSFYDVSFSGVGGGWSFTESTLSINNDFRSTAGTVTLPTATSTIAGSFLVTTGTFQHNNGSLYFTSTAPETIIFTGTAFANVANSMWFQGSGSWTMSDTNATSTNNIVVQQGTVNFPSGVLAIGGTLRDIGGVYAPGTGTVRFYSATSKTLTAGGSSFNNVIFYGAGSWSFTDTNVTVTRNLTVQQGTLTMPSIALLIGGSYDNNATVVPGTGTVQFNSNDGGETVAFGSSSLYNVVFNNAGGGWTITEPATTTNNFTLTAATAFTVNSGQTLAVGNTFTNSVGGAATTWTGSALSLYGGNYSLNAKANTGDSYATIRVAANTDVKMWNSSATTYVVDATGSLYSQDHNAVDGDLYIWGTYERTSGTEYWNRTYDFDGTNLGGSARQVDVRFASGASALFTGATLNITGSSTASTTIDNQGSGTYTVTANGGTVSAQYYEFSNLGGSGLSLLGTVAVPSLRDGVYTVGVPGATALTLSSTTIDASPAKQIYNVRFATTSAIAAYNVSQTDGTPTSFWWFRNGTGNLYGEAKDNDTGNPGSVRFDDSSIVVSISGTVYSDAGVTPLAGGTCDGSTQVVRVVVQGGASYTGSCSNVNGSFTIPGVTFTGDPVITVYLDNASGGQRGSVVTQSVTGNITNLDIYANRVIIRNEGNIEALTIDDMSVYDSDNDSDIRFTATNGTTDTLRVLSGNELFVFASSTFTPGGVVTIDANAAANSYDGSLSLGAGATFNAYATSTLTIGGRFVLANAATFNPASSTVLMNATTSGKSITAVSQLSLNELTFNGSGGTWNISANLMLSDDMNITAGIVTGTSDITLSRGAITGNGTLSLGAGTTTVARTNTLGGTTPWTFYNLQLGNGVTVGTTTPVFTATTTVAGKLTIAAAHYLDAGATTWDLSGTGTVFVENGTLLEDTSTIRYSGAGANVRSTTYYNLDINSGAGSQTYTATGLGIIVSNNLTVGGTAASNFNLTTSDPAFDVNGSVVIRTNGTLTASDTGTFSVAGSYTNNGTFVSNSGTITFDGAGTTNISAGNGSFGNVRVAGTAAVTIAQHATSTGTFRLQGASSFTVASGQSLAVQGNFINAVNGAVTTWTGSTLRLFGNATYLINNATTSDTYGTLSVDGTTQIRMWNSSAATYDVDTTASLYSQDHLAQDGDLYIWGSYRRTTGVDYWSYGTDFDGTNLGGVSRKVDVFFASGASATFTGGNLAVIGATTASTTLQNQGSGSYGLTIGGTASTTFRYFEVTDTNSSGLVFTGTPTVHSLSNGSFGLAQTGGSTITVGGTVITQNPAKNFNQNRFYLDGAASGNNVTATGTSNSAWRFANHYGDIDGEGFDVDPNGDPGYVAWDDSAALITVSGRVFSDEGSTVSSVCDGTTNNVTLRVAGITSYSTSCNAGTGAYSISGVSYGVGDSLVVYIDNETEKGAHVTIEPISNITNFDIYENRVIVRHENTNPISIDDLAVWDSSDDADVPFTAVDGSPDTLTLPANRKLLVASGKTFEPGGNVTLSGAGAGAAYDGTLELQANAVWQGQGVETLSVGGSMLLGSSATFNTSNGTTTFTTTGAARTIDLNEHDLYSVVFSGSGSWTITDPTFTVGGNFSKTAGTLTFPTGTSTFSGSFVQDAGTFVANNGIARFIGAGGRVLKLGGSDLHTMQFAGGNYVMTDVNATSTASVTITSGTITLPSGFFSVAGDFRNTGGAITHNTSELVLRSATTGTLLASSSDLFAVRVAGGGAYTVSDANITFLDDVTITSGSFAFASGTVAVGGSWNATSGTFSVSTTTVLFNSADGGETIAPGNSPFYSVQVSAPTGGYTLSANATTTRNFTLASASNFTVSSGVTLKVLGVFSNTVGGTNTTWNGSTLALYGSNNYSLNSKTQGADRYNILAIGPNTDIRMWNSSATTTSINSTASLYSQDHNAVNGALNIYGDFHVGTSTEYWSYATDFDGTSLFGVERAVTVSHAANATTTVDGGTLNIIGTSGNQTTITNQGSGTYAMNVAGGTFNALHYRYRNLGSNGLTFSGSPSITSLSNGDFELAVNGGTLMTVSSSTINANASFVIAGNRFATTTAITGNNVTLVGATSNAWTFTTHTGNLDGEAYDDDGVDACGSIRWSDSACLITQQTQYRWRNDDGGLGVPDSEWFNSNWAARKAVRIDNADTTTYTDAVVELTVPYDSDMQADFDDLRFTAADGITAIPYWIGSTTNSVAAEVWVKVPSLPAEGTATVFMYYYNPTATSSDSVDDTFLAADDFEDNDITEYSGQTTLFSTGAAFAHGDGYGLDNNGDENSRANLGGIYRTDQVINQGETIRYWQYVDTSAGSGDETCTKFAVQSGSPNSNYAVCIEQFGTDRISLVRNAVENDTSGTILASTTVSYATGWYEIEVDFETDDDIIVSLYNAGGTLVTTISDNDTTYSSGGMGFTYWFHYGGWDNFSSRPTLTTEPAVRFGAEQTDGGASWKAAQNSPASYDVGDVARLRIAVENSGLTISAQQFQLEFAAMGAAPSCEAVNPSSYVAVPVQASCGTSAVCMTSSSLVTNGAATGDLLFNTLGLYTAGQYREDPSNTTSAFDVGQDEYTELEYALTTTSNVSDQNLCFRVTNNGTDFDTYLRVARLSLQFDPVLSTVALNGGDDIALLPGATTTVYATGTVSDLNGYADLAYATSTIYRSGASGGAACTANNNDCYISSGSQCQFTDCSGNSCTVSCRADIYYHADATDVGSTYPGEEWYAFIEVEDTADGYDFETSLGVEMLSLRAIEVGGAINYGALEVNQDTGSTNASTTVDNQGNTEINVQVEGTNMSDGSGSQIPSTYQKFATSTFNYSGCGSSCYLLSSTSPFELDVDLAKPTVSTPPVSDEVYWGIAVPFGVNSTPHQGVNVFTPVSP